MAKTKTTAKSKTVEIEGKYDTPLVKTLYNLGASSNIISLLILLFHAGHSIYTHSTIHLSLVLFNIVKIIGLLMQLPYQMARPDSMRNVLIFIALHTIITCLQIYGIFVMKL